MINYSNPDFNNSPAQRKTLRTYTLLNKAAIDTIDVSIITPYYNTPELFVETLISVVAQSLQNWEWIVVDDGSTDAVSVDRLRSLTKHEERIKIVRQENAGTAAARNTGAKNARGRYICLLDHDDMIEPTYLEKCVWFLDSYPEFSFCSSYNVVFGVQEFLWTKGYERAKDYLQANSAPPIAVIKRSAFDEIGGFDETIRVLYEDWDFWLAMANAGHWGYTIPEFLQWYRKLESGRYEQILKSGYDNSEFARDMQKKYPDLHDRFPDIHRKHQQPYENLRLDWQVQNKLASNANGRNVLFILPQMVVGGADKVNLDLIEGLIQKGCNVTICATLSVDNAWEHLFTEITPDVFILPNFLHITDFPRFLAYLIDSRQIDSVVISGSTLGYQFLPYLRNVSPKTSFIDISHVEELDWLNGGHPRFAVGYQDLLDLNIVTTDHLAKWMVGRGACAERIKVLYTGVESPELNLSSVNRRLILDRLGIAGDIPVIVFAGRLCDQKRPLLLIEILERAHHEGMMFDALIIGDGELRVQVESLIDEHCLRPRLKVLGYLNHEQWLEILTVSDILLMPSRYEGISLALLEAMAASVVPVVANVGGHSEVVDENKGFLIALDESELESYVDALRRLIGNPDQLETMSRLCRTHILSKFKLEDSINFFHKILLEADVLREKHPRQLVNLSFAKECMTQALETKRLNDALNWMWQTSNQQTTQQEQLEVNIQPVEIVTDHSNIFAKISVWLKQSNLVKLFMKL